MVLPPLCPHHQLGYLARRATEEWLFAASLIGFVVSSLILRRLPHYTYEDFEVVFTLAVFLVVVRGLERHGLLSRLAVGLGKGKHPAFRLVVLTGMLSALVTNDVAVLVMVPLTLAMDVVGVERLVVLEALAANAMSALTPFGNPQNLFIYYHYGLHIAEFVGEIFPFALASLGLVALFAWPLNLGPRGAKPPEVQSRAYLYLALFLLFALVVLKVLPIWVGAIPLVYALIWDRKTLRIDYFLLGTLACFFGFTDNLASAVRLTLTSHNSVFLYSLATSQLISNVPSALLFADFTQRWQPLLWGVSVGGYGTLVGSLASLIAYRLYVQRHRRQLAFLGWFHAYNFLALAVGVLLYFALGGGQG